MHRLALAVVLWATTAAAPPSPRPPWAEGVAGWGRLESTRVHSDLAQHQWSRAWLACATEKGRILALDTQKGTLLEFRADGALRHQRVVRNWQPTETHPRWRGLACQGDGSRLAFWNGNDVVVLTPAQVESRFSLRAHGITSVVWHKGDLVAAIIPLRFRTQGERRGLEVGDALLARVTLRGEERERWLAPEPAPDLSGVPAALSSAVLLAPHDENELWVVHQHTRQRLRLLRGREEVGSWEGQKTWAGHEGERGKEMPAEVKAQLTEEGQKAFRALSVPTVVSDVSRTDQGLVVLWGPQIFPEAGPLVEVYEGLAPSPPLLRLGLSVRQQGVAFTRLVAAGEYLWLFPQTGQPEAFQLPGDVFEALHAARSRPAAAEPRP